MWNLPPATTVYPSHATSHAGKRRFLCGRQEAATSSSVEPDPDLCLNTLWCESQLGAAAKLARRSNIDELHPKPASGGRSDWRATQLTPGQVEAAHALLLLIDSPTEPHAAIGARQRAMLDGVGRKLVHNEGEALNLATRHAHRRTGLDQDRLAPCAMGIWLE